MSKPGCVAKMSGLQSVRGCRVQPYQPFSTTTISCTRCSDGVLRAHRANLHQPQQHAQLDAKNASIISGSRRTQPQILCKSASEPGAPAATTNPTQGSLEAKAGAIKGCRTVLSELQGLDFSKAEVSAYFQFATKLPKGSAAGADAPTLERAGAALSLLLKVDEEGDPLPASQFPDLPALQLTQAMLTELWRWRRRGGGLDTDDEDTRPHQKALAEIQNIKPEDIDRISSSLLDGLPLDDAQKRAMSGSVQQAAMGAINGAVWGNLLVALVFVILFNFARGH